MKAQKAIMGQKMFREKVVDVKPSMFIDTEQIERVAKNENKRLSLEKKLKTHKIIIKKNDIGLQQKIKMMMQETKSNLYEDSLAIEDDLSNIYIKEILIEFEEFLRKYQPCNPNLNVNSKSTFDYYVRTCYRPDKDISHVYELISLTLIMCHNRRVNREILQDQQFSDRLLVDLKKLIEVTNTLDLQLLRIIDKFTKQILNRNHYNDEKREIQEKILVKLTTQEYNLNLLDVASISQVCHRPMQFIDSDIPARFLQAYKKNIIFDAERKFISKPEKQFQAVQNLIVALTQVFNKKDHDIEIWNELIGYLKACLSQMQENKIAMKTRNFTGLLVGLSKRDESDIELWGLLTKVFVSLMNSKSIQTQDIMLITRQLVNSKVRSDKLYEFIVRYFMTQDFSDEFQQDLNPNVPIFFFFSLAKAHPSLDADVNEDFYSLANAYLRSQAQKLTERQIQVCLEIEKLNVNFVTEETRFCLNRRIEETNKSDSNNQSSTAAIV